MVFLPEEVLAPLRSSMSRHVHSASSSGVVAGGVVNSRVPWKKLNAEWRAGNRSSLLVVDDVFTPAGLDALKEYMEDNTMWHSGKLSGYICAFNDNGFASPLIAQTTIELQEALSDVFCDHRLSIVWGYKYPDGDQSDGIDKHADYAAVNVNCWTTSDSTIEPGTGGGMLIWPSKVPQDWISGGQVMLRCEHISK